MTYIFLDTMVYLHFTWFEDLPFETILNIQDFCIIVPNVTLQELDSHKDTHPVAQIRSRAKKVLDRFVEIFMNDSVPKGAIEISEFDESVQFDFTKNNLDRTKKDHCLLAAILEFRERAGKNVDTLLITQDRSLRLKANRLHTKTMDLSDTYKLPSQLDPVEQENRKLKNEIQKLTCAVPKLSLKALGEDGNCASHITLNLQPPANIVDVDDLMNRELMEYPPRGKYASNQTAISQAHELMLHIPEEEYDRYHTDRLRYIEEFEIYLQELKRYRDQCKATVRIYLTNSGNKPADDVDLYIHFPDGFSLYELDSEPDEPEPPSPPQPPMGVMERVTYNLNNMRFPDHMPSVYDGLFPKSTDKLLSSFSLEKTNSYELKDHFKRIKHGHEEYLPDLIIAFDSYAAASSFKINYRITAANLPDQMEGEMNVVVRK